MATPSVTDEQLSAFISALKWFYYVERPEDTANKSEFFRQCMEAIIAHHGKNERPLLPLRFEIGEITPAERPKQEDTK